MKPMFYISLIVFFLTACMQQNLQEGSDESTDTLQLVELSDTAIWVNKLSFKNVSEIVADTSASIWVNKQGESFSLALHFQYKDTLAVSYSPECWLTYPYKMENDKIVVYWENNIDTKYDFELVKAINKIDKKYIGKPFMVLELVNDTTLNAVYLEEDLVKKINSTNKKRIFFPDKFTLVQEDGMYD
jgi:hypothetical protein